MKTDIITNKPTKRISEYDVFTLGLEPIDHNGGYDPAPYRFGALGSGYDFSEALEDAIRLLREEGYDTELMEAAVHREFSAEMNEAPDYGACGDVCFYVWVRVG